MAHFLVLNNLTDEAKPVALERGMCPPELAGALLVVAYSAPAVGTHRPALLQACWRKPGPKAVEVAMLCWCTSARPGSARPLLHA